MILQQWAAAWGIPQSALDDLRGRYMTVIPEVSGNSEAAVQAEVRLRESQAGNRVWRNNVGACKDDKGRMIRYGLANDSARMNQSLKSSDLIGITPVRITPAHVGGLLGVFTSLECKRPGWKYRGTDREVAQKAWLDLITSFGGIARFVTGVR